MNGVLPDQVIEEINQPCLYKQNALLTWTLIGDIR
jgi:hypothetical protein